MSDYERLAALVQRWQRAEKAWQQCQDSDGQVYEPEALWDERVERFEELLAWAPTAPTPAPEYVHQMADLLRSACAIAERKGAGTAWERFIDSVYALGLNGVTARTYRVLPHEAPSPLGHQAGAANPMPSTQSAQPAALLTLSESDDYWLRNLDRAGHSAFSLVVDYLRKAVREIDAQRAARAASAQPEANRG